MLTYNRDDSGTMIAWLEKLGLKNFLKSYPLHQLIQWGWLRPQHRISFPIKFFEQWEDYPYLPWEHTTDLDSYAVLWDYSWIPDEPDEHLWFLDPAFRPNEGLAQILKSHEPLVVGAVTPSVIQHKTGREVHPYKDYFFAWQGFALIDVIQAATCVDTIYRTPDMVERAKEILGAAEYLRSHTSPDPSAVLTAPNGWGGLAELMTWLAHLRSFREALFRNGRETNMEKLAELYKLGSRQLADHLGVTDAILAQAIQNKLLVLANSWKDGGSWMRSFTPWNEKGWAYLRGEIQLAVSWLLTLSGKPFSYYADKWKTPYFGNSEWAPLEEVLPYKFFEHDKKFARVVPYYIKQFNSLKKNRWALEEEAILSSCRKIRRTNYPFNGFLAAFYELHEHLSYRSLDDHGVDFRELRPLDYFAMLAIHAEGCFRRELDSVRALANLNGASQTLVRYIAELASARGMPTRLTAKFGEFKHLADLKHDRSDPIGRIHALKTNLPEQEHILLQAFLCCVLARNYFAHHDFLHKELLRTPLAGFLLKGIILSVMTLLNFASSDDEYGEVSADNQT